VGPDVNSGMGRRLVLASLLSLVIAGCGGSAPVRAVAPAAPVDVAPVAGGDELPLSLAIGHLRRDAARKLAFERWRRAELAKARRSPTVAGALRRALLARHIGRAEHDHLRGIYETARADAARLPGLRGSELRAVVGSVEALAASRRLTAGRFTPVFLTLRRNDEFWRSAALPSPGRRETFGSDPAVFQYYPGRGMQLQQLASWGRVNAQLGLCLRRGRCPRKTLRTVRRSLDRLVALGARRDRFIAWEYYFSFAGGTPPWISGMTQGTAVQALARASRVYLNGGYRRTAVRALGAFRAPPPVGVRVAAPGGSHYLMYSFSPGLRILNGDLQAITGLRDLAVLGRSRAARVLYRRGERAARGAVASFDTGAWSLYSQAGRESTLSYHQLVGSFLGNLCRRTRGRTYCSAARRFARYEREPPRIRLARLTRLRAERGTALRFTLSKLASVRVRVTSRRGVSVARSMDVSRGTYTVPWTPRRHGRYRVSIAAQGPSGPVGVRSETVEVRISERAAQRLAAQRRAARRRAAAERRAAERRAARDQASRPGIAPLRKESTKRR
jgi:D-glucuronyl C5-epimerase-like protein